ncbi:MAG TPA: hypothetical protein VG714_01525 [Acidobacteriaceae bacterium]|nr:hypothetical protein [Acidobacteriaceae bacterium]
MKLWIAVLSLACITGVAIGQPWPFQEYPTKVVHGKAAKISPETGLVRQHITVIRKAMENGPNFAGHYTVAEWGCGTACGVYVIIDDLTGKVYAPPEIARGVDLGVASPEFRPDSTLMVVANCPAPQVYGLKGCERAFYQWKDSRLLLLKKEPVKAPEAGR